MECSMGYRSQDRVRLIASAVPSIHTAPAAAAAAGWSESAGASVRDSAKRKRELCNTLVDNSTKDSPTASDAGLIDPEQEVVSQLVPQPTSVLHCGSQCNLRPFHRSSAVQVQPRMVSVGCQTESPLPSPAHSDDESSSVTMDHPGDMPWSPEEEMMSESSDEEPSKEPLQRTNVDLNAADKFIVCQAQLMSLFTICPSCCGETQGNVEQQEGTYIKIKQVCAACELRGPKQHLVGTRGLKRSIDFLKEQHMQVSALIVAQWRAGELWSRRNDFISFDIWHIGLGKLLDSAAKERGVRTLKAVEASHHQSPASHGACTFNHNKQRERLLDQWMHTRSPDGVSESFTEILEVQFVILPRRSAKDEEHLLHMQALDQRAQETSMENWLNPHCSPRCDRNYGHPV
ncbi:uncharacterized protein [Notothenia coriiceps]|uniref:Uncharacterized protein n=1 Tax=Notothenia coriiceps TaxID=8208 RepID=A0A6I9MXU8_9TELE|nr:PREDICTED: uncharacterized protein C17orf67 homolog [Notothenia coriiceps]